MTDIEVRQGRRAASYTDIKDWVALSCECAIPAPDGSVNGRKCDCALVAKLYQVLRMHVNRKRGDAKAWPSTDTLALLMGRARGDKVAPWIARLVQLGAIDEPKRVGQGGRYIFTIHDEPPPGYAGPVTLGEWYARQRELLEARKAVAKDKRDTRKEAAGAKKAQASPVTPISGEQDDEGGVTPMSGQPDTPMSGQPVNPISGREPDVFEPDEVEPPSRPPATRPPTQRRPGRVGEGDSSTDDRPAAAAAADPVDVVAVELRQLRPSWSLADIAQAVRSEVDSGLPLDLVAEAARLCYANPTTRHPNRLATRGPHEKWWDAAAARVRAATAKVVSADRQRRERCQRCTPEGWLIDHDGPARRCAHPDVDATVAA